MPEVRTKFRDVPINARQPVRECPKDLAVFRNGPWQSETFLAPAPDYFKGSGFYTTDYRASLSGAAKKESPAAGGEKSATAKESKTENHHHRPHRLNRKKTRLHDDDNYRTNAKSYLHGMPARERGRAHLLPQLRRASRSFPCFGAEKNAGPGGRTPPSAKMMKGRASFAEIFSRSANCLGAIAAAALVEIASPPDLPPQQSGAAANGSRS